MKKVLTIVAVLAVAGSAMADLTGFVWKGGVLTDNIGATIGGNVATVNTTTVDLSLLVEGNTINIANLPASFYNTQSVGVAPPFLGGTFSVADTIAGVNTIEGQLLPLVYGVFDANGGSIEVGDFIGLTAGFQTEDLLPGTGTPGLPQEFAAGNIQTSFEVVIPEPATIGLMGVAGLGMFLARRKARR